ncbi:MAG: hypothetical protein A2046_07580 [Bacteroidetes bacterium GWA2_30_7]|nr:MAG: hypothetical protein A2046_07580 [Bacteroidetes bacterium GWA2_30_7]
MINNLSIENFKSIKNLNIDCKKINLFIGKPNVGKSNIIEALSLFNVPYSVHENKKFNEIIRFNHLKNLFYDNITVNEIKINTDLSNLILKYSVDFEFVIIGEPNLFKELNLSNNLNDIYSKAIQINTKNQSDKYNSYFNRFRKDGTLYDNIILPFYTPIRKYTYNQNIIFNNSFNSYLLVPDGKNLITMIQNNRELHNEISSFFDDYKLELVYDYETNNFEIQKKIDRIVYKYPYNLIADTLQRIIFYLTAIETNHNNILLFEEPETHSFPPYTRFLAERIASSDNQYFISTHSPYLLTNLIENTDLKDLNVFITYFDNYETKVKRLTDKQIREMLDDYIDIFYNLNKYVKNA